MKFAINYFMIDEKLLEQLSTQDKQLFLDTLDTLIAQTYEVENEYHQMKAAYDGLQRTLTGIIEFLPTAIWALDIHGKIFLQNTAAKNLGFDMKFTHNGEIEIDECVYLIKASRLEDMTIVQATDITEQRKTQRLASMGQMAAHLAHEIRNPVGSVAILASALEARADERIKPITQEIKKAIWRVERIIKATLMFTKGVAPKQEPFELDDLKIELLSAVKDYSYQKDIDFRFQMPSKKIKGDMDLLGIALQNLIFNAIDAIEDSSEEGDGVVELIFSEEEDKVAFSVYDNGAPIPREAILFDPFKTTKTKGNGLGLALTMQIAVAHGGDIKLCDSEKKGFKLVIAQQNSCEI